MIEVIVVRPDGYRTEFKATKVGYDEQNKDVVVINDASGYTILVPIKNVQYICVKDINPAQQPIQNTFA